MVLRFQPAVSPAADAFWAPAGGLLPEAGGPVRLAALSTPFATGSAEEKTLHNLLAACRLAPSDFFVLQLEPGRPLAWSSLRETLRPAVILLLGIPPLQLGIRARLPLHAASSFDDAAWIPTLSLPELNSRKDIRQALWVEALKPLFPSA